MIAMVKPAQASGTVPPSSATYFGGGPSANCYGMASTGEVKSCTLNHFTQQFNQSLNSLKSSLLIANWSLSCPSPTLTELGNIYQGQRALGGPFVDAFSITYYVIGYYSLVAYCGAPNVATYGIFSWQSPLACPANSNGTPATSCICIDPYIPDSTGTSCISEQYTLTLTPTFATIEPGKTYSFTATVTKQDGGAPSKPVPVSVKVEVDPTSGGHGHGDSTRPKGSVSPTSGNTSFPITFASTDASGTHTITATCDLCANKTETAKIDVKVDGLWPIPASQFYVFIGATDNHSGNHYLTPEAASVLWRMAASYQIEDKFWQLKQARKRGQYTYTPSMLYVNDASLIWGGRFDTKGDWATPHAMHRRGVVIDVRANSNTAAIPLSSFTNFKKMAASYGGADAQVHCTSNKTDGQNRQPPSCIGRDGSQDSNRHMHILLLGVDQ